MQNARQPSHIDMDASTTRSWRIGMDMPPMPVACSVVKQTVVGHTASGCAKLKGMYIERHNKLGRLLLKEIARGRKGGYLVQMDLGSEAKLASDGTSIPTQKYSPRSPTSCHAPQDKGDPNQTQATGCSPVQATHLNHPSHLLDCGTQMLQRLRSKAAIGQSPWPN